MVSEMAYFAKLDENNMVKNIIVISDNDINNLSFPESESIGIEVCKTLSGDTNSVWKQISPTGSFRVRPAVIGGYYDSALDAFIGKKPFPSWVLEEGTLKWIPPIPYPEDYITVKHQWDEATLSWVIP